MHKMDRISTNLGALLEADATHFDAIVVGSGYGGGVSALRLAKSGRAVLVLERGKEMLPGEYPDTPQKAAKAIQVATAQAGALTPGANGLFDIRVHDDMSVVMGCGLGGTSLINANVALEPDPRVMRTARWPRIFADPETLKPYYELARKELGSTPLPSRYSPNKLKALEVSAKGMGLEVERPPINVTFEDTVDPDTGVFQPACNMCGDCCSGCNYGSKNTTLMNYLPRAHAVGATIVTETKVYRIEQDDPGNGPWQVVVDDVRGGKSKRHTLTADIVVLAAGSLGSTEILMRSKQKKKNGLKTSDRLGQEFSGNGDVFGFGFDGFWNNTENDGKDPQLPIYGIGAGPNRPDIPPFQPGPCITGVIRVDMDEKDYTKGFVIEEGVAPGAVSLVMPMGLFLQQALNGDFTRFPDVEQRLRGAQAIGELFAGAAADANPSVTSDFTMMAYEGAASQTQTFLVMSHDQGDGQLEMNVETDSIIVNWPGVGDQENYMHVNSVLEEASDSIWANYLPNPLWRPRFGRKLVTVHPVGGCGLGWSADDGVVDAECRVFTGNGTDVHDGLYVCDGAVIPSSLGLNPLLTITAISERAMDLLIAAKPFDKASTVTQHLKATEITPTAPEEGTNVEAELRHILSVFDKWQAQIKAKDYEVVRAEIVEAIKTRFPTGQEAEFWESFKGKLYNMGLNIGLSDAELATDIAPAMEFVADILRTVTDYIAQGEYVKAAQYLEETCGDFSPDADFHIVAHSLKKLTESEQHEANLTGQITCPYIADEPLEIEKGGKFNLLIADKGDVETWKMIYGCRATSGGKDYYFHGVKTLARRPGSNWWSDLTTLSVDIYEGPDPTSTPIAIGIITLGVQDLLKQLSTVTSDFEDQENNNILMTLATDAIFWGDLKNDLNDPKKRQELLRKLIGILAVAKQGGLTFQISAYFLIKFAGFFGMLVFRAYGEMLAYLYNFPGVAQLEGKVKQLPKLHQAKLRELASFAMETVDENLVDSLCMAGYDVWLFDYRSSPMLDSSLKPFTLDDVAKTDWPMAVEYIRKTAEVHDMQAVVHCMGSMTHLMALLNGMEGIRSVVSSQLTLHRSDC